jgi:hypothetical protein
VALERHQVASHRAHLADHEQAVNTILAERLLGQPAREDHVLAGADGDLSQDQRFRRHYILGAGRQFVRLHFLLIYRIWNA